MTDGRQRQALGLPPRDLSGFPRWRLRPAHRWLRAHRAVNSPWWFSSDGTGRFDLAPPQGTCYLATDVKTALREKFGHELVEQGVVTAQTAAAVRVSTVQLESARWLANSCARGAVGFGMTREIGTCESYDIPQAWAAAFYRGARHTGIRYQTRFTTGAAANAVALFDSAGQQDWPTDPAPLDGIEACHQVGIVVARRPTRRQVRIQDPPAPRRR